MDYVAGALVIGTGATLVMDLWALARRRLFGLPLPDYGLVGRWLVHAARGRLVHDRIAASPRMRGERLIGWCAHYLIGIAFAGILLGFSGLDWLHRPTLGPALLTGIATVAAPFLIMQPCMGVGIAARRAPRPNAARLQSLVTHAVFGGGLYLAGWAARLLVS